VQIEKEKEVHPGDAVQKAPSSFHFPGTGRKRMKYDNIFFIGRYDPRSTSAPFMTYRMPPWETTGLSAYAPNQNHQLSWWYALRLEGDGTGGPTRALNGLPVAFPSRAAAKAALRD